MAGEPGAGRTTALEPRQAEGLPPSDVERARMEIERTRQDLGDTVAALAGKADVKARAKDRIADARRSLRDALPGGEGGEESGGGEGAAARLRETAAEHPTATAALAALAGGILLGRHARRGSGS
jgi:hypothetical protein